MGKGIVTTGEVRFVVQSLVLAGVDDAPEGPVLDALLYGDPVMAPAYIADLDLYVAIGAGRQQPGHWWALVVGNYVVTLAPFTDAELQSRRKSSKRLDPRTPPQSVLELGTPWGINQGTVWELWNVNVRNVGPD